MSNAAVSATVVKRNKPEPQHGQIKMIALDLDGTLLRSDKTIGARTRDALHAAHQKGVKIAFNSGRMMAAMEPTADLLGLDVYMVAYNGATVCNPRSQCRKALYEQPMPLDVARELVALGKERHLQVNYYLDNLVYSEYHADLKPWVDLYVTRTGSPYRFVDNLDELLHRAPYKVLFVTDHQTRDALERELRPIYEKRATVTKTDPEYLEFLDPRMNKGVGLKGLCDSLNLPLSAAMAVGDSDNDAPMVEVAGWGVGVANAGAAVRSVADAITAADCNNDGVAEAVERWVL